MYKILKIAFLSGESYDTITAMRLEAGPAAPACGSRQAVPVDGRLRRPAESGPAFVLSR